MNRPTSHVIKDPVHGTMQFTAHENNWIKPFIDSPNFQRLRHIKQLGMGDYLFPGSVHTRLNHCIGCSFVASQIADTIGLAEEERQLVIIACLLHDIGHGPFSHTFEDVFHGKRIRHEAWTPYFLADFRSQEFFDNYNRRNPRHHLSMEKFQLIEDMIMHQSTRKRVLADIVSSQLDADRLDYLLRDSHFCGVSYGQFDLRWMLNCMTIVTSDKGHERLGITHKGIGVVEHYLMARRLMTRNIYHHHKKLALEYFLIKLLTNLSQSLSEDPQYANVRNTRLGTFLMAAHEFNLAAKSCSDMATLQKQFLTDNYANYKELSDYDVFALIKQLVESDSQAAPTELAKRIHYRQMPKIVRLDHMDLAQVEQELAGFKRQHAALYQDWQMAIIKTPHQSYSIEADPILVINEQDKVKTLDELSFMINAISDKSENTVFLCVDKPLMADRECEKFIRHLAN